MDNMKICPQCNKSVDGNTKFCNQCGYHFPEVNTATVTTGNVAPAAPVNPTPVAPVNPAPAAPVNPMPAAPVNPMPTAPVNNGFQQPAPGMYQQPMNNGAVPPTYVGGSGATNPQPKKGKGGLTAVLVIIGLLVVAALAVVAFMLFGEKKVLELDESKVTVEVDDEVTVTVTNYEDIKEPELEWTVEDDSIATVEAEGDGSAVITGVAEGETVITITGKGCEEETVTVVVEEPVIEIDLEGTAWDAEGIMMYFMEDGSFYEIYELQENYMVGTYSVSEMDEDEAADAIGQDHVDSLSAIAEDGVYYGIDMTISEEYYGDAYDGVGYETTFVFCYNGEDAAIYDGSWDMVLEASETDMEDANTLYSTYFASSGTTTDPEPDTGTTTTTTVTSGSISGISFDGDDRDGSYISSEGDYFVVGIDGDIYGMDLDAINNGSSPELIVDVEGEMQRLLLKDGVVVYSEEAPDGTWRVCYADIDDGVSNVIYEGYEAYSIIVEGDYIYCTDYSSLIRLDFSGNYEELWEYSTFTFEVDEQYIYVFDGVSWEVLDVNTGEDLGYIVTGYDGNYEADLVREDDGYLFFTMYESSSSDIYLYGMDLDGNITQLGDALYGLSYDTYVVLFRDQYVYYTVNDRETLVRVDVTTGEQTTVSVYDEYGCWYINDLAMVGDQMIAYVYDTSNNPYCISIDPDTLEGYELDNLFF